jgi:hypothetical protein
MIICFEAVFNRVLGNSKTHLIVKLGTFPHLRRARAGFGGVVARFARPLTLVAHGAAGVCVNVPPGCGESSGGRRRPGRARRELREARHSLVSERAIFAGVGSRG